VPSIRYALAAVTAAIALALGILAVLTYLRLEAHFKIEQAEAVTLSARAVAAALSDRPHLFARRVDDAQEEERRRILALFTGSDPGTIGALGNAYAPSAEAENIVSLASRQAARVWVVDPSRTVRALTGALVASSYAQRTGREAAPPATADRTGSGWVRPLIRTLARISPRPGEAVSRDIQIDRALDGRPTVERRVERGDLIVVSAAQPVFAGDSIVAAVLMEESTDALADTRATTVENLLVLAFGILVTVVAAMLVFTTWIIRRIVRLARASDAAIDPQGRVRGTVAMTDERDEIGQLRSTLARMLARLSRYNAYLEALAGRLAHELRTPLAVVRSSLDNLRLAVPDQSAQIYIERAGAGVERLTRLIARLSEASRLEQFLASATPESVNLTDWGREIGSAYQQVFSRHNVRVTLPQMPVIVAAVPDALAQLVDKLMENAVSFTPPGGEIEFAVARTGTHAEIIVTNEGPLLPDVLPERLFTSMVSVRQEKATKEAVESQGHLGLGLYIVRIVADFHGGTASAANRVDGQGVRFCVTIPLRNGGR
jgi:two-component system, OmpR family, sensor histidine kinase ChvG